MAIVVTLPNFIGFTNKVWRINDGSSFRMVKEFEMYLTVIV
jgi:hypothetical protein